MQPQSFIFSIHEKNMQVEGLRDIDKPSIKIHNVNTYSTTDLRIFEGKLHVVIRTFTRDTCNFPSN